MKKVIFSILLVGALGLLLFFVFGTKASQFGAMGAAGEGAGPPPETVATFVAEEQAWAQSFRAVGSIEPIQGVLLETETAGIVEAIHFENGQLVERGDILVELDTKVEIAERQAAEALLRLAEVELARAQRLSESGNLPQSDLDRAIAEAQRAEAELENIQALIDRKTIIAPFSGQVGIRQINLGQFVNSGAPIVALQANERVYVNFTLPQQVLRTIEKGFELAVTSNVYPGETFPGTLTALSPEIDPATRSIALQGTLENPDGRLRAGLFVRVELILPGRNQVTAIPATAIRYAPYGDSIYKIEEGEDGGTIARQHFIKIGQRRGDFVSVVEGVEPGEDVVSAGAFKIRNGAPVRINNELAPEPRLDPRPDNS
jgi:membrane fusion protein (multidrug efflux system)